jgi:hypothetical protein
MILANLSNDLAICKSEATTYSRNSFWCIHMASTVYKCSIHPVYWIDFVVSGCAFTMQLYNRLLAAVNNASFLAHIEKLQDESARQHAELSSGNMTGSSSLNVVKVCLNYVFWSLLFFLVYFAKLLRTEVISMFCFDGTRGRRWRYSRQNG